MSAVPQTEPPVLLREDRDGVATLTLNRPQSMNLLTGVICASCERSGWQHPLAGGDARHLQTRADRRGVLMTPFHSMALMSPATTAADVNRHTILFAEAVGELLS